MRFLSIPLRNLGRRPTRSTLTAVGIALAIASFIALVGMSRGLERAWVGSLMDRGTHILAVRKGAIEILTASIDEAVAGQLARVPGVAAAAGELLDLVDLADGEGAGVSGWAADSYLWGTLKLVDGHLPTPAEPNGVVLGQTTAEVLKKKPGETIRLSGRDFLVTGISRQASVMSNKCIVVPLPTLQALLERPGKVTDFNLRLAHPEDPEETEAVLARLSKAFPDLLFSATRDVAENNQMFRILRAMTWGTSTIAFVMALVVMLNTLLMSVMERTHEIGVLSAVGWQGRRVLAMILLEGLALALVAWALGAAIGVGGLRWLASLPRIRGLLEPQVGLHLLAEAAAMALLLGLVGGLYPAWRAIRLNTVDALRYE